MGARACAALAAVALTLAAACGQTPGGERAPSARHAAPEAFDLLASGFHQSSFTAWRGELVVVSVQTRQERHAASVCGLPTLFDPDGNRLQELTPRQNPDRETDRHYFYQSRYAFIAATAGEYALKLENQDCLAGGVGARAVARWSAYSSP